MRLYEAAKAMADMVRDGQALAARARAGEFGVISRDTMEIIDDLDFGARMSMAAVNAVDHPALSRDTRDELAVEFEKTTLAMRDKLAELTSRLMGSHGAKLEGQ